MEKIETQFSTHDAACEWAEEQGLTVIMASLKDGKVTLIVTSK